MESSVDNSPRCRASETALEFVRYALVGAVAFLADFCALVSVQELLMRRFENGVYVSTAVGFAVGLAVNYALSLKFVFIRDEDRGRGRSVGAFLLFGAIGLAGLALTELGMWVGVGLLAWNYMLVKVFVTGAVLFWNYIGRRVFVFNMHIVK